MKIYIASLAHYNAGQLVGKWFEVEEGLENQVQEYIGSLPHPDGPECGDDGKCEEWAIHDYECDEGYKVSESEDLSSLVELAEILEQYGEAYLCYMRLVGDHYATPEGFEDSYCGCWESEQDYAENFIDDCGMLSEMPENLRYYFDYEAFTKDLFINDMMSSEGEEGVHVFRR